MNSTAFAPETDLAHGFSQLVRARRATQAFLPEPVPADVIDTALALAAQAPSGFNFQPWRFLVLTEPAQKARLRKAAHNQDKITQAPVMIVAFGQREGWKQNIDEILRTSGAARGLSPEAQEKQKQGALAFLATLDPAVWLNRQVMIGFTYLMLAFESLGWDTAPMEGFDAKAVRATFELPADSEVVALLAVGRARDSQTPYPGRLEVSRIAFRERYGEAFKPYSDSHP